VRTKSWRILLASLALVAATLVGCTQTGDTDLPQLRVLFIGNSFTFYNGGVDQVLHGLAPRTVVDSATQGGYRLSDHIADPATMDKLQQPGWNRVVLQEQSQLPVLSRESFISSAGTLADQVRAQGAIPLLLMTWARPDSSGVTTAALTSAFADAGRRLKVLVIPAGTAFGLSLATQPDIVLNELDGHPTREGTYLAGCVVFAKIFSRSPVGNTFTGGLDASIARTLQEAAAEATLG